MYCFSAHACRGFHSRSLADHMTTAGNVVRGGRTACRGRCPHRPVLSVDWGGVETEGRGGVWDGGTILPLCRRGVGRDDVGIVPYIRAGGACHSSSRGGSVGRDVPSFCFRNGVDMQLSGPGALIWSAPWVGADHGVRIYASNAAHASVAFSKPSAWIASASTSTGKVPSA